MLAVVFPVFLARKLSILKKEDAWEDKLVEIKYGAFYGGMPFLQEPCVTAKDLPTSSSYRS